MSAVLDRKIGYDPWFLFSIVTLLGVGLVMVTSASLSYAEGAGLPTGYFAFRHASFLLVGLFLCFLTTYCPLSVWRAFSTPLLIVNFILLIVLLVPGISREVNGSVRWLFLGPISIQVSELTKLGFVVYLSNYLVKRQNAIQYETAAFLKPILLLAFACCLLLLEPDFGAAVVLTFTVLGMLFLAGVPLRRFFILALLAAVALGSMVLASPYRVKRLTSFLDPWSDQFNSGYQLTQSLIAFGRGGWFGTGLGNGVQKLLYLPESHTDFIYAVLAEELGLVGALALLGLFVMLVWRTLCLGKRAMELGKKFEGFLAYGIALWFGLQTAINIGVNTGVLPTKGLTLLFISYGGSSLVIGLMAIGLMLRIEYELSLKPKRK